MIDFLTVKKNSECIDMIDFYLHGRPRPDLTWQWEAILGRASWEGLTTKGEWVA